MDGSIEICDTHNVKPVAFYEMKILVSIQDPFLAFSNQGFVISFCHGLD